MIYDIPGVTKRKRWGCGQWLGAFALIILLSCLAATAWLKWQLKDYEPFTSRGYYPSLPDGDALSWIESNVEIEFPPSAYDIYTYSTGLQELFTKVRFSMSADELNEFLESTLCQEPLKDIEPEQLPSSVGTTDWWTPDQAEHLESCTGRKDHSHQTIIIDMTTPDVYIVFVSTSVF